MTDEKPEAKQPEKYHTSQQVESPSAIPGHRTVTEHTAGLRGETGVKVWSPRSFQIAVPPNNTMMWIEEGENIVPADMADHWYLESNGVERLDKMSDAGKLAMERSKEDDELARKRAEEDAKLADARRTQDLDTVKKADAKRAQEQGKEPAKAPATPPARGPASA